MIYIDSSRYNNIEKRTGVENYSLFLIKELIKQHPGKITLITPRKIDLNVPQIVIPFKRMWTLVRLSLEVWKNKKIDNLFIPSHILPLIHPRNTTITIHDVVFKRFPKSYGKLSRWYLNWGTKRAVKRAKKIIVPSEATEKDLIKFYKCDPEKIHVTPLGMEPSTAHPTPQQTKEILEKYHLTSKNYFLFVGRIETKKNIHTLVRAYHKFNKAHPDTKLVLAGKTGRGGNEILIRLHNRNIVVTGFVSELEKQVFLKNCLSFIFPSQYEGFGLPLLEAMQAKAPIIASKIPSSLELVKENALFFKPQDIKTLIKHMEALANKPDLARKLTEKHQKQASKYTWKRCAEQTWKILMSH